MDDGVNQSFVSIHFNVNSQQFSVIIRRGKYENTQQKKLKKKFTVRAPIILGSNFTADSAQTRPDDDDEYEKNRFGELDSLS